MNVLKRVSLTVEHVEEGPMIVKGKTIPTTQVALSNASHDRSARVTPSMIPKADFAEDPTDPANPEKNFHIRLG
jgi:hypothetical protein